MSEACDHEESDRKRRCVTVSENPEVPVVVDPTGGYVGRWVITNATYDPWGCVC